MANDAREMSGGTAASLVGRASNGWRRASRIGLALVLGVAMFAAGCAGGEEGESGGSCVVDSDCARGQLCEDGACGEQQCFSAADCGSGPGLSRTCLESGLCSVYECFSDDDCVTSGLGAACIENACFADGGGGCVSNADCPSGQVCNGLSGTCGAPPDMCAGDTDCPTGMTCDTATGMCGGGGGTTGGTTGGMTELERCQAVCSTVAACPEIIDACGAEVAGGLEMACQDQFCADAEALQLVLALEGVPCETAVPLAIGQLPEELTSQCNGGGDPCADVTCDDGERCDPESGECKPFTCDADANEPNNDAEVATALSGAQDLAELSICEADEDWFNITLAAGDSARIGVTFLHSLGDIDVELYDAEGFEVDSSASASDDEWLAVLSKDSEATYTLRVYGFEGAINDYGLTVELNPNGLCALDFDCAEGQFCTSERLCGEIPPCESDLDCSFGDVCNTETGECERAPCATDDDCFLGEVCEDTRCVPAPCESDNDCGLSELCDVGTGDCEPFECSDDGNEPNNTRMETTALTGADETLDDLTLCVEDEDWFTFTLAADKALLIRLFFTDATGDVDAALFVGDEEEALTTATSGSDNEFLAVEAAAEERVMHLRVYAFSGSNTYTLEMDFEPEGDLCGFSSDCEGGQICEAGLCGACSEDSQCGFREVCMDGACLIPPCQSNDDCGFGEVCREDGECVSCVTNEDCVVGVCSPMNTCVECLGDGDCEGGLCDPAANACVQCLADDDCGDGTCVEGACQAAACNDDPYEPNESAEEAEAITAGMYSETYVCVNDEDWFSITLEEGDDLYVTVEFTHEDGDIDVNVRDSEDGFVGSSVSTSDNEYVGRPNLAAGTYYIRIYGFGEFSNPYGLSVQVNPDFAVCSVDEDCAEGQLCNLDLDTCE